MSPGPENPPTQGRPDLHVVSSTPQVSREDDQVPGVADSRLESSTFSSDLSVSQYGACVELGLEPVGFVQGFCAMQLTSWYSSGYWGYASPQGGYGSRPSGYFRNYSCPHGMLYASAEHRVYGYNAEMTFNETGWRQGFKLAYDRMLEEAQLAKAHGVIGVAMRVRNLIDPTIHEFHITGTAVRAKDVSSVPFIFNTFLAGQKLVKIIEAGFMPVSVVATLAEVAVYGYCITEAALEGLYGYGSGSTGLGFGGYQGSVGGFGGGLLGQLTRGSQVNVNSPQTPSQYQGQTNLQEISQVCDGFEAAYQIAETLARKSLEGDSLHGADMELNSHEGGRGNFVITCTLQGTRVKRFSNFDTLDPPTPVVGLWG